MLKGTKRQTRGESDWDSRCRNLQKVGGMHKKNSFKPY